MTDFLGNLIRRSAGESAPQSILQPRLPSLFEPLGGGTEFPDLALEPVEREHVVPTPRSIFAPIKSELPTFHSSDIVEPTQRKQTVEPTQTHRPAALQRLQNPPALSSEHETTEPAPFFSQPVEPERTILPPPERRPVANALPQKELLPSNAPEERVKRRAGESFSNEAQSVASLPPSIQPGKKPGETAITPPNTGFIENSPARKLVEKVPEQPKATLAPIVPAITIAMGSSPVITAQSEPAPTQDSQRTVEIHIGRIEVRAAAPAVSSKRAAKRATMSLEEYLRSRPGEKP
jgi:hypothetical protein